MSKPLALIIDDEPDIRELLKMTLARMDVDVIDAEDLTTARKHLKVYPFDLCLTDMRLPDGDGIELVKEMQSSYPDIPVAVITAFGNVEGAVNTLKAGAFDYVSKPIDLQVLRNLVNTALKLGKQHEKFAQHKRQLLGESAAINKVRQTIQKLARSQAPVYISGASGSGKELVARLIHEQGPRADKPFIPVNCGAIPAELMESEFFGYKKGSFTGAVGDKEGLFQAANGGTLFLDEVADLPFAMQVKLLRAIQEKAVRAVGDQQEESIDVRILSATHQSLQQLVEDGKFREDLYYRINVIELAIPGLQQRVEDIPILAEHVLSLLSEHDPADKPRLAEDAITALCQYSFPGNVRELENILERAMTLCENNVIEASDLNLPQQHKVQAEKADNQQAPLENYLGDVEKQAILDALEQTRWNKTKAAKLLGITFRALRYRLKKLGLED